MNSKLSNFDTFNEKPKNVLECNLDKISCPICREIIEDVIINSESQEHHGLAICTSCESRFSPLQVKWKSQAPSAVTEDICELERRLNAAQINNIEKDEEICFLLNQLKEKEDKIDELKAINFEKNSVILENQIKLDEFLISNTQLVHQVKYLENKLKNIEEDNVKQNEMFVEKNEILQKLQENVMLKNEKLKELHERLINMREVLDLTNDKYSHVEELVTKLYKENIDLDLQLKECEKQLAKTNNKLQSNSDLESEALKSKIKADKIENDFTFLYKEYAYICSLILKRKITTLEDIKIYLDNTFHILNEHLENIRLTDIETLDYEKLLIHPKYQELNIKLQDAIKIIQSILHAADCLKQNIIYLNKEIRCKNEQLNECAEKIEELMNWNDKFMKENEILKEKVNILIEEKKLIPVADNNIELVDIKGDVMEATCDVTEDTSEATCHVTEVTPDTMTFTDDVTGVSSDVISQTDTSETVVMQPETVQDPESLNSHIINHDELANKITELTLNVSKLKNYNALLLDENENLNKESRNIKYQLSNLSEIHNLTLDKNEELLTQIKILISELDTLKSENINKNIQLEKAEELQRETENRMISMLEEYEEDSINKHAKKKGIFSLRLFGTNNSESDDEGGSFPRSWMDQSTIILGSEDQTNSSKSEKESVLEEMQQQIDDNSKKELSDEENQMNANEYIQETQKLDEEIATHEVITQGHLQNKLNAQELVNKIQSEFIELQKVFDVNSLEENLAAEIIKKCKNLTDLLNEKIIKH